MTKPKVQQITGKSLADFVMDRKRDECAVCSLPDTLRDQLKDASKRRISRSEQIEWLASEYQITLTNAHFDAHINGRHSR